MTICGTCGAQCPESAHFCHSCAAPLAGAKPRETRKVVTVLFCDLTGSTGLAERLDPEALRHVLARYFACAREVIERHGGTVEKFVGDAVMAVFGVPTVHEDDALRAVRAAGDLREAIAHLNRKFRTHDIELLVRTGVNTGEVFVSDDDVLVTGDAVVTAKRLEEMAPPGGVLLGSTTYALVRDAVAVEPESSLALKGKRELMGAYLLDEILDGAPSLARRLDSPLVGRDHELAALRAAFVEAVAARECRLVTVLGAAGIGKTRLTHDLQRASPQARAVAGRCLPYGEGITYWPLVELVRQVAGLSGEEPVPETREHIAALVADAPDADRIAAGVAAALALGGEASAEEVFFAVRRLLEELAHEQPLLLIIDDLHWAEPVFLDLLEYITSRSRGFSILMCCTARQELLELRPDWSTPRPGATTVLLDTLAQDESRLLLANLLGSELSDEIAERITAVAAGNPLFLEELLRMLIDEGVLRQEDDDWRLASDPRRLSLPATISALLAARLDRLGREERLVIECAAVAGEIFSWSVTSALVPPELRLSVGAHLQSLARRELIRPLPAAPGGEDEFRFGHILIRDAAYAGLAKEACAELHERAARWAESRFGEGMGSDEIVGYHLARAADALAELDPLDERARALGSEAAARLASAARLAVARGDSPAAAMLLERTLELISPDDPERPKLLVELADALRPIGRLEEAKRHLREAMKRAEAGGLAVVAGRAALDLAFLRWYTDPSESVEALVRTARDVIPLFEQQHHEEGVARAWAMIAEAHWIRCELGQMREALEHALEAAQAGGRRERSRARSGLARAAMLGPTPVAEGLRLCRELAEQAEGDPGEKAMTQLYQAYLEALDGRFDQARARAAAARPVLEGLGKRILLASQRLFAGQIELLAGDPAAAEEHLRDGYETLEALGELGNFAGLSVFLAAALHAQGRNEEAEAVLAQATRLGNPDDAEVQILTHVIRARLLAAAGAPEVAEQLAHEAVALAARTDASSMRADALLTLAVVLRRSGENGDADASAREALTVYEAKGNRIGAEEARRFLSVREVNVQ
jgi:class 3 adenylate cyclase/tetratricopeptide (TPR) repeat protein